MAKGRSRLAPASKARPAHPVRPARPARLVVLLALTALAFWAWSGLALAQDGQWRPLSVSMVKEELEFRLARNPSYATIWNLGYDIYRLHYRNQDTAMTIHLGYM